MNEVDRFWSKVEKGDGCWIWKGAKLPHGYGLFSFNNKTHRAHRMSWALSNGDIGNQFVLHKCDNPSCVNPDHLFLGTQRENVEDMVRKGRQADRRGEKHPKTKRSRFTDLMIRVARRLRHDYGWKVTRIAKLWNLKRTTVVGIVYGRRWTHLPMPK